MPMHPPAPSDLQGLIEAWRQTIDAVIDLGIGLRAEDFDRETTRPGHTIRDVITQVVAREAELAGDAAADRSGRAGAGLITELREVNDRRLAQLYAAVPTTEMVAPGMPVDDEREAALAEDVATVASAVHELRTRCCEVWIAEQDIREAIGRPGNLDTPAAAVFLEYVEMSFAEKVTWVAGERELPVGTAIIVESTGPLVGRMGVWMSEGNEGRTAVRMFQGDLEHSGVTDVIPMPAITSIALSTEELTRRVAGRRAVADTRYTVRGDEDLAAHVLDAMVVEL